jgi:hypothetical protein
MATAWTAIASTTVGAGGAATVTFSSIPQTYKNLLIKVSARNTRSAGEAELRWTVNGSATSYANRLLQGNGSTISGGTTGTVYFYSGEISAATATASVFGSADIYIPNYTGGNYKSVSADTASENNATSAYTTLTNGLWSNTAAITSIAFYYSAGDWAQYSTFTLFGINNS